MADYGIDAKFKKTAKSHSIRIQLYKSYKYR